MTSRKPIIPLLPYQKDFVLDTTTPVLGIVAGKGSGKALHVDELVFTPIGNKRIGDVAVGDTVIGGDGKPTTVLGVYPQGTKQLYAVEFRDGTIINADADHLWEVSQTTKRQTGFSYYKNQNVVMTTHQLIDAMEQGVGFGVPLCQPVEFDEQPLGIDAYLLGCLIGDGGLSQDSVTMTAADEETIRLFRDAGYDVLQKSKYDYRITGNGIHEALRHLKLKYTKSNSKFIPDQAKYNSVDNRWAVLQGLMDTDGTVDKKGRITFTTVSQQLANDVVWIAQSLGFRSSIQHARHPTYTYKGEKKIGQLAYTVQMTGGDTSKLFRLERKKSRVGKVGYKKNPIISITPSIIGEAVCIAVDNDSKTFLTTNFIVTHNTYCVAVKALHLAQLNVGHTGLITEPTYSMVTDTLLPTMFDVLDEYKIPYRFRKSPNPNIYVQFKTGISTILLRSAQNHMRQRGINAAWVLMDEIDTMGKKDASAAFDTYTGRLRAGNVRQLAVASTPEGYGWMYDYFVTKANDKKRLIRAKTTDNHHLPDDYIQRMYASYPPSLINAYVNGEFVNLNGNTVYYCFDRKENHTDDTLADYPNHIIHVGCDFNIGNTNAVVGVIHKEQPLILDEMKVHDTDALIKELKHRYPKRKIIVYPDSSGKNRNVGASTTSIAMLKEAGFELCYRGQNPRVIDRVNSVNAMFLNGKGERRLKVNTRKCPDLTECLEQQVFTEAGEPDKQGGKDHKNDAIGYLVYYRFPIGGQGTLYSY